MLHRRSLVAASAALAALLAPAGSRGQNLEVSPVVVEVSASTPSAIVTVKNLGAAPMRYQVTPFAWSEDRTGRTSLEPTKELAVFPTLFQLAPGASRKVRVGATVQPAGVEHAWRIFIEELPDAVAAQGQRVVLRTRFSVPVFQAPARAERRLDLRLAVEEGGLVVLAVNGGTVRQRPATIDVKLFGEGGVPIGELSVPPWYVLPGGERAFDVKLPKELCALVRKAIATAVTDGRKSEASQDLPSGACAR